MSGFLERITGTQEPEIKALTPETLDNLWHEAESLGSVSVKRGLFDDAYEVTIAWKRSSGSRLYAEAKDTDVYVAFHKCIIEARSMGAGCEQ